MEPVSNFLDESFYYFFVKLLQFFSSFCRIFTVKCRLYIKLFCLQGFMKNRSYQQNAMQQMSEKYEVELFHSVELTTSHPFSHLINYANPLLVGCHLLFSFLVRLSNNNKQQQLLSSPLCSPNSFSAIVSVLICLSMCNRRGGHRFTSSP